MFPLRDHNPSECTPYVVYGLMAVNVLAYLLYFGIHSNPRALMQFYQSYAIIPAEITRGEGSASLLTSVFIHGGLMHLGGNMLFLWIFGDNLEDEMGHLPFLAFYLACGIGAGIIHVWVAPYSQVPTIGASGAIAGVMGGYLLLYPKARVDILLILIVFFRVITVPAALMLGLWFGLQFLGGLGANPDEGGVAYWAHAGGFVVGLVLTLPLWLLRGGTSFWTKGQGRPANPRTQYTYSATRIPRLPRKQKKPGYNRSGPWGK
ncbi:Rhomboid protease GluP [Phaeobacter sp. CECT 5382]|uniref:rhomboid family intramembrane serine protease n=1 Tax=Rhodobacterales TaxID=204455 RepID=UPI0006DA12C5|nr:rhomboid family intramembrane serine protease [Phaeobacter sp. CECT 5382]CUH87327.1 Rhomboid protease GluP [Phaeobacter sp. CECT 5382]